MKKLILILLLGLACFWKPAMASDSNVPQAFKTSDGIFYLDLPPRADNAPGGAQFAREIAGLNLAERETAIVKAFLAGNVPSFSRKLRPLTFRQTLDSNSYTVVIFPVCDYLAIGSDEDYLYIPLTPSTAQYLAERMHCSMPTQKLVDIIYNKAGIKLRPQPIPPSDQMTTVPVFMQHTDSVKQQLGEMSYDRTADSLIAGHKKDIIISNKIYSPDRNYERVVIYGWHRGVNDPIQPVYNGHSAQYADYSHGVRLIWNTVLINGDSSSFREILKNSQLAGLLSSEGVITKPYYPPSDLFTSMGSLLNSSPSRFILFPNYPNPFNGTTTLSYRLKQSTPVNLSIYNAKGEKLVTLINQFQPAGEYRVQWSATTFSSGCYFYRLSSASFSQSRKMLMIK